MKTNGLSCSHSCSTAKAFKASAAEPAATHSCHQRQYPRHLVMPLGSATAPVRYQGPWLGRRLPDYTLWYRDTLAYDIVIQFFLTIQALLMFCSLSAKMNQFQQKLEGLSQKKPLTKLCLKCPLHLKYVLALPWEILSIRVSHHRSN